MSFNPLTFAVTTKLAADKGITDPSRQTFYGLLGGAFGSSPVGVGVVLALANQEVETTPPAAPTTNALSITSSQFLPSASDGQVYTFPFKAVGGTAPYTWAIISGSLPNSNNFSLTSGGVLGGTADSNGADDGSYPLAIQVTDSAKTPATQTQLVLFRVGTTVMSGRLPLISRQTTPKRKLTRRPKRVKSKP